MSKKGIVGLPTVALVSALLFTIILIFWAIYFYVFGFADQNSMLLSAEELTDSSRLINLMNLPVEVEGKKTTFADLAVLTSIDKNRYYATFRNNIAPYLESIPHPLKKDDPFYSGWEIKVSELNDDEWQESFKVITTFFLGGPTFDFEAWSISLTDEYLKQELFLPKDENSNIKIELYLKCECKKKEIKEYVL